MRLLKTKQVFLKSLTFYHGQGAPLSLLPARMHEPLLHALYQHGQMLGIGAQELIELGKFARAKEDFRYAKLEIALSQVQRLE